ncbi:MAG: hypothetical protein AAB400_03325 [Patescibacteria group bacterium]
MNSIVKEQHPMWQYVVRLYHEGMLPHALLFVGCTGDGEKDFVQTFIDYIKPSETITVQNEDEDRKHPIITVKQIQDVRQKLSRRSISGRIRIVLIPCAEELTAESGNALLKTLEETPADSVFILKAFSRLGVMPTVASRCAVLRLPESTHISGMSSMSLSHLISLSLGEKLVACQSLTKDDCDGFFSELEGTILREKDSIPKVNILLYRELINVQMSRSGGVREQSVYDAFCLNTSL